MHMTETELNTTSGPVVDAERVSDRCELAYDRYCTGTGILVEDPYQADVRNNPGQMIVACAACLRELAADI